MTRNCSNCGEELLGAVNQCWRCGREVLTRGGTGVSEAEPLVAEVFPSADDEADDAAADDAAADDAAVDDAAVDASSSGGAESDEVGSDPDPSDVPVESPAAEESVAAAAGSEGAAAVEEEAVARGRQVSAVTTYPAYMAAGGGAVSSLLLAVIGCISAYWLPEGGLIIALMGIGMGAWGLYSNFRSWAIVGVSLCVVAFLVSGVGVTVKVHKALFGYSPFDKAPVETDETGLPLEDPEPLYR